MVIEHTNKIWSLEHRDEAKDFKPFGAEYMKRNFTSVLYQRET